MNKTFSQLLNVCRDEQRSVNCDYQNCEFSKIYDNDCLEKLETDMKNFMDSQTVYPSVVEYTNINKLLAICSLLVSVYTLVYNFYKYLFRSKKKKEILIFIF